MSIFICVRIQVTVVVEKLWSGRMSWCGLNMPGDGCLPCRHSSVHRSVAHAQNVRAKAEVVPECSGVLVGSGGDQERCVRVVGAAGDVAHCAIYREDAAGRQVDVKLVERRRRQCRAD